MPSSKIVFETDVMGAAGSRLPREHGARPRSTEEFGAKLAKFGQDGITDLTELTAGAPVIETARLRMRPHRVDDFAPSFAMWSDPVVTRYIGGKPSTEQQTWSRLLNYAGHWALLGFGYWAVEDKTSRQFIGELGFADFKRDIDPRMRDVPELGWAFASSAHGRGYATEAVGAVASWGDEHLASMRTVCLIHSDNLASVRVAEKCGYRPFESTLLADRPTVYFERLSDQIQPNAQR